jgi:site-specific DNA-methyltransferase (adenine-specific)
MEVKEGDLIFDSHLGSGSIAVACDDMGFDLVATEIDKDYFDKANKRIDLARRQQSLF